MSDRVVRLAVEVPALVVGSLCNVPKRSNAHLRVAQIAARFFRFDQTHGSGGGQHNNKVLLAVVQERVIDWRPTCALRNQDSTVSVLIKSANLKGKLLKSTQA